MSVSSIAVTDGGRGRQRGARADHEVRARRRQASWEMTATRLGRMTRRLQDALRALARRAGTATTPVYGALATAPAVP